MRLSPDCVFGIFANSSLPWNDFSVFSLPWNQQNPYFPPDKNLQIDDEPSPSYSLVTKLSFRLYLFSASTEIYPAT